MTNPAVSKSLTRSAAIVGVPLPVATGADGAVAGTARGSDRSGGRSAAGSGTGCPGRRRGAHPRHRNGTAARAGTTGRDLMRRAPAPAGNVARAGSTTLARVCDPAMLRAAWRRVWANHGGPGGDGITVAVFAGRLDRELALLGGEIRTGHYRPGPLRRVTIPKQDGVARMLAIPCVRDRMAQGATLAILQPVLERRQSAASFAYRPARGVADALAAVRQAHAAGLVWTLEADIFQYFDSIPHRRLLTELAIWIEAEDVLRLIAVWLDGFTTSGRGIPQGAATAVPVRASSRSSQSLKPSWRSCRPKTRSRPVTRSPHRSRSRRPIGRRSGA